MYSFAPLEQRIAIIDLGSNSVRLMVAQYTPGKVYKITDEVSRKVRLSEGMSSDGRLHAAGLVRAFETIGMFQAFCAAQNITRIIPVATAAVRDASNGSVFLDEIRKNTGLDFRTLSGQEEAYYGALGVVSGLGVERAVVMDIGGGSAEISLIQNGRFSRGATTPFGAIRATEAFLPGNSARPEDMKRLTLTIDDALRGIDWLAGIKAPPLVGVGGTIRQLARMDRARSGYPFGLAHGYTLSLRRLEKLIVELQNTPVPDRVSRFPGLQPDRADIILAGAVVASRIIRHAGVAALTVSGQGLREGLFYDIFYPDGLWPDPSSLRRFSVLNMARLYGYEEAHTAHVAHLATGLFDQLIPVHGYGEKERDYLWAASLLHDIGTVIDYYDHHKHSAYMILNAGLPGYSHREIILIALLCMYHRKGAPTVAPYSGILDKKDRLMVSRLAALLRLAEYLDRSRAQTVADVEISIRDGAALLLVHARNPGDAAVEIWEAGQRGDLFEQAYGLMLEIEAA